MPQAYYFLQSRREQNDHVRLHSSNILLEDLFTQSDSKMAVSAPLKMSGVGALIPEARFFSEP